MIDLLCCFQKRDHPVHLNREFHLDLLWWHHFLFNWHGAFGFSKVWSQRQMLRSRLLLKECLVARGTYDLPASNQNFKQGASMGT